MKIQVLSDLHIEFHQDGGRQLIEQYLNPKNIDVLVIAGDLATSGLPFIGAIRAICKKYKDSQVIYVPGNHDFYGGSFLGVLSTYRGLENTYSNLSILYNKAKKVDKYLFVGTTLWFGIDPEYTKYKAYMNDFKYINRFEELVFKENRKAKKFLKWHLCEEAIVVSHHLPSWKSVPERFKNSKLNMFYVCDLEKQILDKKPTMWIHGHTHHSCNHLLGKTHVVCNPFGYAGYEINPEFIPNFVVDTGV